MWQADEVVKAVKGRLHRRERETFSGISTDSRTIGEGELFVPLGGLNFDGHQYLNEAFGRSGAGSLCEEGRPEIWQKAPGTVILVENTLDALLDLARFRRDQRSGTFVAITGSNGKTTTKELAVAMLGRAFTTHFNEKNYNNLIGVSKSILSMNGSYQVSVFELGTNSKGEIARLASVVQPHISLITNVNPSHLEGLGDIEGVGEEKLDLFRLTREGGTCLVNADDPYILRHAGRTGRSLVTFAMEGRADLVLTVKEHLGWEGFRIRITTPDFTIEARTSLLGRHNLSNILSAVAIAYVAGVEGSVMEETIGTFSPYSMRLRPLRSQKGYLVVDDSYNANPSSMEWALRTLEELPCSGKRIAILGDMRELGPHASSYHRELGRLLRDSSLSLAILTGDLVRDTAREAGEKAHFFEDRAALIGFVASVAGPDDVILIKGSRASRMDEFVEALA